MLTLYLLQYKRFNLNCFSCSGTGGLMLASVLGSLAALASMAVTLALCYLFWRKRSGAKEAKDELEPLQVGGPTQSAQATPKGGAQPQQQQQGKNVVELTRHNVEDRLYQGTAGSSSLSLDK